MAKVVCDGVGIVGVVVLVVGIARISTDVAMIVVGGMLLVASIVFAMGEAAKKQRRTRGDQ